MHRLALTGLDCAGNQLSELRRLSVGGGAKLPVIQRDTVAPTQHDLGRLVRLNQAALTIQKHRRLAHMIQDLEHSLCASFGVDESAVQLQRPLQVRHQRVQQRHVPGIKGSTPIS
jgi:hypothetical protein